MEESFEMGLFDLGSELNLPDGLDIGQDTIKEEKEDINPLNTENGSDENLDDPLNNDNNDIGEDQEIDSEEVANEDAQESSEGETSPNLYSSVAAVLYEQGLLPSLDLESNKIESVDDFVKAFNEEKEKAIQEEIKTRLGEDGADAINSGVTVNEYQNYQEQIKTIEGITEDHIKSDIELSKRIIYQDLINQGVRENTALKLVDKTISAGDDAVYEEAIEAIKNVKQYTVNKFEEVKLQKKADAEKAKKLEIEREKNIKKTIYDKDEFIKGKSLNKKVKDEIYKNMTHVIGVNPDTGTPENKLMRDRREQGVEFDAKMYYFYTITNGFKDLSKLTNTAKSKAVSELERAFRDTRIKNDDTPSYLQDGDSYDGIFEGELNL